MVLVDSCVWIDAFRGHWTPESKYLAESVRRGRPVLVGDLILAEVLQGFKNQTQIDQLLRIFEHFSQIEIVDFPCAEQAARHHRHLRSRGVTPRNTIDTLIATRCIMDRIPLLTSDPDFLPFVAHFSLELATVEPKMLALNEPTSNPSS
jgi:predicted nucleic acid-binding protein